MTPKRSFLFILRGLMLVALAVLWIAGMLLASYIHLPPFLLLLLATGAALLLFAWYRDQSFRLVLLLALALLLGAWRYTIALPANDPLAISRFTNQGSLMLRGTVSDEPVLQTRTRLLHVTISAVSTNGARSWQQADGQIEVQTLGTSLDDPYAASYGDSVELTGKLQPPSPQTSPDIQGSMAFPRLSISRSGGVALISWLYALRVRLAEILAQSLPQPLAALLIAITLGLRTPALKPLATAFNVTGTAHLVAPSGFKVTILASLILAGTRWLEPGRRNAGLPVERRRDWRRWLTTLCVVVSVILYTLLSGAGPAALRAGIMGILIVIAPRLGRTYNIYTALAGTALLMSVIDPFVLWDISFLLSFVGTLGIVVLTPTFQRSLKSLARFPGGHTIGEIIAVTLAAQIATLPISGLAFQQISFVAPLANVLTVPLLGLIMVLGLLICGVGLIASPLALVCGWLAWPLLWYLHTAITWCANLPGAYLTTGSITPALAWAYYLFLTLLICTLLRRWIWTPDDVAATKTRSPEAHTRPILTRRTWQGLQLCAALLILAVTALSILFTRANGQLSITFLDVGPAMQPPQGEAILIHTPTGRYVLLDGGLDATSLGEELDSRLPSWQRSLDMIVLTSPRSDHLSGLEDIIMRYSLGTVIDAGMLHPSTTYANWRRNISERGFRYIAVAQGTTISIDPDCLLQVLWPEHPLHEGSNEIRDNGLIVRLISPGVRVLFLGAAAQSSYALTALVAAVPASMLQANIVQFIGESGTTAIAAELTDVLQRVNPTLLVVTPAELTTARRKSELSSSNSMLPTLVGTTSPPCTIIQTAQAGTLTVTSDDRGWSTQLE